MPGHGAEYIGGARSQRHPHANLARALRHQVREHAIDADACQDQRQRGQSAKQGRLYPPLRDFLVEQIVERHHVGYRLVLVDRPHRLPRGGRETQRISAGVNCQIAKHHPVVLRLPVGEIHLLARRIVQAHLADIAHDAYNS